MSLQRLSVNRLTGRVTMSPSHIGVVWFTLNGLTTKIRWTNKIGKKHRHGDALYRNFLVVYLPLKLI